MKIEIYNEKRKEEKTIRLRLVEGSEGVTLQAIGENGMVPCSGNILTIDNTGCLVLWVDLSKDIGLKLDSAGAIQIK